MEDTLTQSSVAEPAEGAARNFSFHTALGDLIGKDVRERLAQWGRHGSEASASVGTSETPSPDKIGRSAA